MDNNTVRCAEPEELRTVRSLRRRRASPRAAVALRPLVPGMRRLLFTAAVLVLLAGIQLFVFTGRTGPLLCLDDRQPAGGGVPGRWLTGPRSRSRHWPDGSALWANARIAVPAVFVFTVLTLAVTLTHLGQLHLGARFAAGTQIVTVAWIAIYVARSGADADPAGRAGAHPGGGPAPVGRPARLAVRRAGRPGDRPARPGHSAVRGARAGGAAVALETDPDDGPGDRRLADQPGGGRRARAAGTGRAPPAARRRRRTSCSPCCCPSRSPATRTSSNGGPPPESST